MKVWLLIPRLLAILAVVGLLIAPTVTSSAMAAASVDGMGMTAMAGDMSCCLNQKPAVPDCQKTCPVAIICMAKYIPGHFGIGEQAIARLDQVVVNMPTSDRDRAALAIAPPRPPPRS